MAHRDAAHENEITPVHVHFRRMVRPLCTCSKTYFSGPYVHNKRDTIHNSESVLASLVSTQSIDMAFPVRWLVLLSCNGNLMTLPV